MEKQIFENVLDSIRNLIKSYSYFIKKENEKQYDGFNIQIVDVNVFKEYFYRNDNQDFLKGKLNIQEITFNNNLGESFFF